jgi:hypothetical protein
MDQRLIARAWRAYLATDGVAAEQPDCYSALESLAGLTYAALRRGPRILAVYRVTNRGRLRRLKRWPLALARDNPNTPVQFAQAPANDHAYSI